MERATFGAGCFWGVEAAFRGVKGVTATGVGYMGGSVANPTYDDVCAGRTGHTEVVQVEFDPLRVTYDQLLDLFWRTVLANPQPHEANGLACQGRTVPLGDLLSHAGAGGGREGVEGEGSGAVQRTNCDRTRPGVDHVVGRGVPPAVPGKERRRKLPYLNEM